MAISGRISKIFCFSAKFLPKMQPVLLSCLFFRQFPEQPKATHRTHLLMACITLLFMHLLSATPLPKSCASICCLLISQIVNFPYHAIIGNIINKPAAFLYQIARILKLHRSRRIGVSRLSHSMIAVTLIDISI